MLSNLFQFELHVFYLRSGGHPMPVDNQQDMSTDNFQPSWRNLFRICSVYIRRYLKIGRNKHFIISLS